MCTVLAVSPHLDDAAFSCGHMLSWFGAHGVRVIVATPFSASVVAPRGFALECQLDKGLDANIDYMALRRREDRDWALRQGFETIHGPFTEAPHRGYDHPTALFSEILANDGIAGLDSWLRQLVADYSPTMVFGPLGVGDHVDHRQVRTALEKISATTALWVDQPYAWKVRQALSSKYWTLPPSVKRLNVPPGRCAAAAEAASAYTSQIDYQFGGEKMVRPSLLEAWGERISLYPSSKDAYHRLLELTSFAVSS